MPGALTGDAGSIAPMTFANVGTLGVKPGSLDTVVQILTRPNSELASAGCLLYEVGTSPEQPDTVYVTELWESAEAHRASLELDSVRTAIREAMPHLTGEMGGYRYD